jgi:hypothetical protein
MVALCGDLNSRTGGLSDITPIISGKDSENISNLNYVTQDRANDPFWYNKPRENKDKLCNSFGKELVQLCQNSNMRIMNGFLFPDKTDNFTCHAPLGKSTVDYLISTSELSEIINNFEIMPKLVESDHTPMLFSLSQQDSFNNISNKQSKNNPSNQDRRYRYIFEKAKVKEYRENLRSESAQLKLQAVADNIQSDTNADVLIRSTYHYIESSIKCVFKKKFHRSAKNSFPTNAWYDHECKAARKAANEFAKNHDLTVPIHNQEYRSLYKNYKRVIQQKKRLHQKLNREELDRLHNTNQTECWKSME